jgi:putative ABC transport system permease protein
MAVLSQAQTLIRRSRTRQRALASVWVTAREAFWIALETLRTHKLRSFLTLLGVVISTTTLIVVMSIINGMNLYIADRIANLGANVFVVSQFSWAANDEEWLRQRRRNKPIRIEDYQFLKENLRGFKSIGASAWLWPRPTVKYNGHSLYDLNVTGQTPSMVEMQQEQVEFGRYFTETEFEHAAPVCFIGQDIMDEFFPAVDPIDKVIDVAGQSFRVVGVAKRIGKTLGQSQDDFVQIPLTTFARAFMARPRMNIHIQAWSGQQMVELQDEARALMRARHHLPYKETDDFGINASETIMGIWQDLTGKLFGGTIGIVAVFMVIGGIVIMNIMLASVTERTHEIGIRKSLGARRRDIMVQFVIESAVMAGAGGLMGILLAVGIAKLVDIVFTAAVPVNAIVVGLVLSTSVGLFFGIYPASKAAKLDPIEALRTEN